MKTNKKTTLPVVSIFLLFVFLISCQSQQQTITSIKKIEINSAFQKVYKATQEAIHDAKGGGFKVESIDLTFKTVTSSEGSAGVKLWVVTGKYSRAASFTQSTTWSFSDDSKSVRSHNEDKNIEKFKEYLISVIEASKNIQSVDNFGLNEFQVDVEFVVSNTTEAGVEIEIVPVSPSIGANYGKEFTHSISIKFSKKA